MALRTQHRCNRSSLLRSDVGGRRKIIICPVEVKSELAAVPELHSAFQAPRSPACSAEGAAQPNN
eukprot:10474277-Lingulodinium_polyedra.AAC.1